MTTLLILLLFISYPERGDVKCTTIIPTTQIQQELRRSGSSGSVNVQAGDAAPKISPAEMYVRLLDERHVPWYEPPCLPGNELKSRIWEVKH